MLRFPNIRCIIEEKFKTFKYRFSAIPDDNGVMIKMAFLPEEINVTTAKKLEIGLPDFEGEGRVKLTIEAILADGTKMEAKEYIFDLFKESTDVEEEVIENPEEIVEEIPWINISSWAEKEVLEANKNNLIPDVLNEKDYTQGISRSEFAAITVKLYESISKKEAKIPSHNPFIDTNDENVLKAYNLGITNGVSENEFAPENMITREQMATMITRTLEKMNIKTNTNTENKFNDDVEISEWAKVSVYFMNEKGIIKGMENNLFKAKNTATREQALLIANRCMENL